VSQIRQQFQGKLSNLYSTEEVDAIFFALLLARHQITRISFEMTRNEEFQDSAVILKDLNELSEGIPLQYLLGRAPFFEMELHVSPAVLIPRPETEELVSIILAELGNEAISVLDIGTGSGCIALALSNTRLNWQITGLDVSESALEIARKNADEQGLSVNWILADISSSPEIGQFDVIVSNPPYIPLEDAETLEQHVLNQEPHLALFAPANDALFFYRAIKVFTDKYLTKPDGRIYFETHYNLAADVAELFSDASEARVLNDMFGKPRFVAITY
jgi:release factor glutamine methyltransferase